MKNGVYCFLTFAMFCASCSEARLPGYSALDNGVEFKLHTIGNHKAVDSDHLVVMNLSIHSFSGQTLLYQAENHALDLSQSQDKLLGSTFRAFREGDSATVILRASSIHDWIELSLADSEEIRLSFHIKALKDPIRYAFELKYPDLLQDYEMKEQELLHQFLDSLDVQTSTKQEGIYYIEQETGEGKVPTVNQEVTLHYEGFFLNGEKFDSTRDRNEPFTYTLGEQGQVIPGLERAIRKMRAGGRATVILPSQLAFPNGSSTGIVPPFTSVIYQIELLEIQSPTS